MTPERFKELAFKLKAGTITEVESKELLQWAEQFPDSDVPVYERLAISEKQLEENILKNIRTELQPKTVPLFSRPVLKWTIAAAVIIAVSLVIFWQLFSSNPKEAVVATAQKHDANPGYDKAILTLADGKQVVLDNETDGILTNQGNATLVKNEGGIIYQTATVRGLTNARFNVMTTPRGGQYKITLSDGTLVWLNSSSSIKYPVSFYENKRIIELTGEAYFEVAKNVNKPFIVKAAKMDVHVLGTHFNINAYSNETEINTTLLEGSVRVNAVNNKPITLRPEQQVKLKNNSFLLIPKVDVFQVMAWQKGIFVFRNADLSLIARQLERWYDVDVLTEGNISTVHLGGGISKKLKLSEVLGVLKSSGVDYKWSNEKLILYIP
jgi:transmembrane sensor